MSTPRSILTIRRDCRNTTSTWRGSFPHCRAYCSAQGEGVTSLRAIKQPSALDTIFWVMTTMSPAWSDNGAVTAAWWISATRSAPGVTMGMPGRPITRSSGRLMKHAHVTEGKRCVRGVRGSRASRAPANCGTTHAGPQTAPGHLARRYRARPVGYAGSLPPDDARLPGADGAESCHGQRRVADSLEETGEWRSCPDRPDWAPAPPALVGLEVPQRPAHPQQSTAGYPPAWSTWRRPRVGSTPGRQTPPPGCGPASGAPRGPQPPALPRRQPRPAHR